MITSAVCIAAAVLVLPQSNPRRRIVVRPPRSRSAMDRVPAQVAIPAASLVTAAILGLSVGCAAAILLATVTVRHGRAVERRAYRTGIETLTSALDTVIAELRIGAHPADACRAAAREHTVSGDGASVATVFAAAAARAELGGSMADAFGYVGRGPQWHRIAAVWRVADRHGLRLAELLDAARTDMRERARSARRIEASMAGPRATATVLAALPAVGVALGQGMGAAPLSVLTGGGIGAVMLVVGTGLACAGLLWTDAIVAKVAS